MNTPTRLVVVSCKVVNKREPSPVKIAPNVLPAFAGYADPGRKTNFINIENYSLNIIIYAVKAQCAINLTGCPGWPVYQRSVVIAGRIVCICSATLIKLPVRNRL